MGACGNDNFISDEVKMDEMSNHETNLEKVVDIIGEEEALKEQIISILPQIATLAGTPTTRGIDSNNEEQVKQTLATLSTPIVNMLKSHGFTEKDWEEFDSTEDPAFIFSGIVFLGMLESNSNATSSVKTRSESDSCFDPYKVLDCVLQATGVMTVIDAFLGQCITKYIAYEICKQAIEKVAGPIAVAIALGDFAHCMGWLDFSF